MEPAYETRESFLAQLIGDNPEPRYKVTQPGDPAKQKQLKAALPNLHATHNVIERFGEIPNDNPLVYGIKEMRNFLLEAEMELCGGG